jgi:hypothetical protein
VIDGDPVCEGAMLAMGLLDTVALVPLPIGADVKTGVPEGTGVIDGDPVCEGAMLAMGLLDTVALVPLPLGADVKTGVPEGT